MQHIYIIAVPEDAELAEKMAAALKRRGCVVRVETGAFGYAPARPNEKTLLLWSRAAVMSVKKILMTNRGIDAWAEGKLVVVKLDHALPPVGLSDIEMFDFSFEPAREHKYSQIISLLRDLDTAMREEAPGAAPPVSSGSDRGPTLTRTARLRIRRKK